MFAHCCTAAEASNVRIPSLLLFNTLTLFRPVDIYDGDHEPMIYHGRTFTSKVSLRDICKAIAKYAFVTSPYPIIISAEVHCGIDQQEQMAEIMSEAFGDKLVQAPVENRPKLDRLPSPEQLKYKILLKVHSQRLLPMRIQADQFDRQKINTSRLNLPL
jgi:hypothetical protein